MLDDVIYMNLVHLDDVIFCLLQCISVCGVCVVCAAANKLSGRDSSHGFAKDGGMRRVQCSYEPVWEEDYPSASKSHVSHVRCGYVSHVRWCGYVSHVRCGYVSHVRWCGYVSHVRWCGYVSHVRCGYVLVMWGVGMWGSGAIPVQASHILVMWGVWSVHVCGFSICRVFYSMCGYTEVGTIRGIRLPPLLTLQTSVPDDESDVFTVLGDTISRSAVCADPSPHLNVPLSPHLNVPFCLLPSPFNALITSFSRAFLLKCPLISLPSHSS